MTKIKDARNVVIVILCLIVICMGIGYAYLQTSYTVSETKNLAAATWNIGIKSISVCEDNLDGCTAPTGNGINVNEGTKIDPMNNTKAFFTTSLTAPGDSVTYKVEVENKGTLDAKLNTVTWNNNSEEVAPEIFAYNNLTESEIIEKGTTKTFYVIVSYDDEENAGLITKTNSINLNFIQGSTNNN